MKLSSLIFLGRLNNPKKDRNAISRLRRCQLILKYQIRSLSSQLFTNSNASREIDKKNLHAFVYRYCALGILIIDPCIIYALTCFCMHTIMSF